jgi:hypothetical protein
MIGKCELHGGKPVPADFFEYTCNIDALAIHWLNFRNPPIAAATVYVARRDCA